MEYFRVINLRKEPFSNSPEPEFFFPAAGHVDCLQQLELAVRLKRGLNVVAGEVGTGKTTLCRQLIRRLSADEEAEGVETHLIMDPSFSDPDEFLSLVSGLFGLSAEQATSQWQYKENIKKYLFTRCVDEKKTVVLIIDEGQKLPGFCIELLREFLNYETNEHKLLQIVIFAQNEFRQVLAAFENFVNRINLYYTLGPLNFTEMCGMITFRLENAAEPGVKPRIFTYPGLYAIYKLTRGYPRNINTLCHHVMLSMIIQNKVRAGWKLVRACAGRTLPDKPAARRRIPISASAVSAAALWAILAAMVFYIYNGGDGREDAPARKPSAQTQPVNETPAVKETPPVKEIPPARVMPPTKETPPAVMAEKPATLGKLTIEAGYSVKQILWDVYADFDDDYIAAFKKANPRVRNIKNVTVGDEVTLPARAVHPQPEFSKYLWVEVERGRDLAGAYALITGRRPGMPHLMLMPYWNGREGLVFSIFLKEGFGGRKEADDAVRRLPPEAAKTAKVIDQWAGDTVFYHHFYNRLVGKP